MEQPSARSHQAAGYPSAAQYLDRWAALCGRSGGRASEAGRSSQGRSIPRFDFGPEQASGGTVLLTGLMHGLEYVGGLALLSAVEAALEAGLTGPRGAPPAPRAIGPLRRPPAALAPVLRLVVLPIVNPDGFAENCARLAAGRPAFRRGNGRGVDLNRNFPPLPGARSRHPLSGSRHRVSPYYAGPRPLSEPETGAIAAVADQCRPSLALGFHSFGELLLYPYAHRDVAHPREADYRALGAAFVAAQPRPYRLMRSHGLYPVIGDMDDWLDGAYGTRAFTVEVGRPAAGLRRLTELRRLAQPFWWMNPLDPQAAVDNVAPAVLALLRAAVAPASAVVEPAAAVQPRFELAAQH